MGMIWTDGARALGRLGTTLLAPMGKHHHPALSRQIRGSQKHPMESWYVDFPLRAATPQEG